MKHSFVALGLAVFVMASASAHHSWTTAYRSSEPDIEIAGVITQLEWKNPHVRMQVTADAGKPTAKVWLIESTSVAQLARMDVTPDLVKVGLSVRISGFAGFDNNSIYMNHLLLPDNREVIFLADAAPRWPGVHIGNSNKLGGAIVEADINKRPASIFAVWNTVYGDPKSHAFAAQQAAAKAAAAKEGPKPAPVSAPAPSSAAYCAAKALPMAMTNPYPIQFIKKGQDVVLKLEEYDQVRTIHIGKSHEDSGAASSLMGYSSGVWQGAGERKLVVTTTKIDNKALGSRAKLIETFELSADRNHLDYTSTVSDPDKPGEPVTTSKYWQYRPGATVQPYNCTL